jgi:hypothetical protein
MGGFGEQQNRGTPRSFIAEPAESHAVSINRGAIEKNRGSTGLCGLFFGVFFFGLDSVDVVVGAEWNHLKVWRDVMHYAPLHSVHVESVAVHESHAA